MFSKRNKEAAGGAAQARELQRLRRQDLLELLLEQMRENDGLGLELQRRDLTITELGDLSERLKAKLDLKDEQIAHLKDKLDLKDEQMSHLREKLDDKDALIEKLKGRLDLKDQMIAAQVAQGREADVDLATMEELLVAEEFALEALIAEREAEADGDADQPAAEEPVADAEVTEPEAEETESEDAEPEATETDHTNQPEVAEPVAAADADESAEDEEPAAEAADEPETDDLDEDYMHAAHAAGEVSPDAE